MMPPITVLPFEQPLKTVLTTFSFQLRANVLNRRINICQMFYWEQKKCSKIRKTNKNEEEKAILNNQNYLMAGNCFASSNLFSK